MNFVQDGSLNTISRNTSTSIKMFPSEMFSDEDEVEDEDLRNWVKIETLHNGNRLRNRKHLIIDL